MSKWIKNFDELAVTPLRHDALSIIEAGLFAVDTKSVIQSDIKWDETSKTICIQEKNICFSDYEKIYFVGIGKCAVLAGETIEEMLGDNLTAGIVLDVREGSSKKLSHLWEHTHYQAEKT